MQFNSTQCTKHQNFNERKGGVAMEQWDHSQIVGNMQPGDLMHSIGDLLSSKNHLPTLFFTNCQEQIVGNVQCGDLVHSISDLLPSKRICPTYFSAALTNENGQCYLWGMSNRCEMVVFVKWNVIQLLSISSIFIKAYSCSFQHHGLLTCMVAFVSLFYT